MLKTPIVTPEAEELRLNALYSYDILGDGLEHELDNLVKLAAQVTHAPIAYVTLVDREFVLLKAAVGLNLSHQTKYLRDKDSVTQFVMWGDHIYIVEDTLSDENFSTHSIVLNDPFVRFYASFPLKDQDGFPLGNLCIMDTISRHLSTYEQKGMEIVALQVITHLSLKRKNAQLELQTKKFDEFIDIFKISQEIHCILDRSGAILFINDAVTSMLQYQVNEVIGKRIWDYCYRDDIEKTIFVIEKGLKNKAKQFNVDFRLVSKTGAIRWISWGMVAKDSKWYCYGRDITEKKSVEHELTKLSFVASKVNNGVVINDPQNNVTWVNQAFEKITGFNLQDLKGKPLGDLISGPKTDLSKIEKARELTQKKESFTVDILAYRKDRQPIWLSVYNTVVLDDDGKVETEVEIIIDITEKKKAEEELEILSLVASKTDTGVAITDDKGEVTWVNAALEELVGYTLDELRGHMPGDIFSGAETDRELINLSRIKASNKQPFQIEVLAIKKDGQQIWLSVSNTPILDSNGKLERQVELIYDITQRKQVEREMIEAREKALQLSEAKEMFLSVMSHEIRTPLNAVIGMTHLLLENDPKSSQIEDLNILKFSGENLLNIINDILDFTKIETGNLKLESVPFSLYALCTDIINSLKASALKRGNELILVYDDLIPEKLLGDKTRLYQIIMNLLGNAIKFTDQGKVELVVKSNKNDDDESLVHFEIKDSGIGIAEDKQSYIFESFTQARSDISRKYGGTGLGLAITKKLLKLYHSEIKVASIEGKGTIFSFEINFTRLSDSFVEPKKVELPSSFVGKRILVVDDNEINILIAKRFLSNWGLVLDVALNGEEAIKMIVANIYDLVFMDIRMPGIDGFDATRIIREIPGEYYKNLPIIALTASTLRSDNLKFKESGMNGHILKPFNPEEIKSMLESYFKK